MNDSTWFVRRRTAISYKIVPVRWQGWAATALYVAIMLAFTPLAAHRQWLAYGTLCALATFTFILVAWRNSSPR